MLILKVCLKTIYSVISTNDISEKIKNRKKVKQIIVTGWNLEEKSGMDKVEHRHSQVNENILYAVIMVDAWIYLFVKTCKL